MEGITGYLILALCLPLLCIGFVILLEKFKKPVNDSLTKRGQSRHYKETVIKGFVLTGFILFSRKLIYYVRFDGIIQTKFSIWWMDGNAQTMLIISIIVFFLIGLGMQMFKTDIEKEGCLLPLIGMVVVAVLWSVVINGMFEDLNMKWPITGRHLILTIFSPLLEFKILCSGKYLGFLTSILLVYFIVTGYKKLTQGIRRHHPKSMIIAPLMFLISGLMVLIFLGFSFYKALGNPGNWEQQLNKKVLAVSGETDMMDLLDAVHSINREESRYQSLEQIVAQIVKEKDFRWEKEIYQLVIDAILPYDGHQRRNLLEKIALWIAGNGDVPWAEEVAMSIQAKNIRNNVLKKIREKTEVK